MKNNCKDHTCVTLIEVKAYMDDCFKSPADQEAFEHKLDTCDTCLERVEAFQNQLMAEQYLEQDEALAQEAENIEWGDFLETPRVLANKQRSKYTSIGLAASIALLVGMVWLLWPPKQIELEKIKTENTKPKSREADSSYSKKENILPRSNKRATAIDTVQKPIHKPLVKRSISSLPIKQVFTQKGQKALQAQKKEKERKREVLPIITPEKQMALAEDREKIKAWESRLSKAQTRRSDNKPQIITPLMHAVIKSDTVMFRFTYDQASVLISICDSANISAKPVYKKVPLKAKQDQSEVFEKIVTGLPPGTYYWRIYSIRKKALFSGKFRKVY